MPKLVHIVMSDFGPKNINDIWREHRHQSREDNMIRVEGNNLGPKWA